MLGYLQYLLSLRPEIRSTNKMPGGKPRVVAKCHDFTPRAPPQFDVPAPLRVPANLQLFDAFRQLRQPRKPPQLLLELVHRPRRRSPNGLPAANDLAVENPRLPPGNHVVFQRAVFPHAHLSAADHMMPQLAGTRNAR